MPLLILPVLGSTVFGVRKVAYGLATFAALLVAGMVAARLDINSCSPPFVSTPLVEGRPDTSRRPGLGIFDQ